MILVALPIPSLFVLHSLMFSALLPHTLRPVSLHFRGHPNFVFDLQMRESYWFFTWAFSTKLASVFLRALSESLIATKNNTRHQQQTRTSRLKSVLQSLDDETYVIKRQQPQHSLADRTAVVNQAEPFDVLDKAVIWQNCSVFAF